MPQKKLMSPTTGRGAVLLAGEAHPWYHRDKVIGGHDHFYQEDKKLR